MNPLRFSSAASFFSKAKGLLMLLAILLSMVGGLNYSGLCWRTMGYLSDEEKTRAAIGYIINKRSELYSSSSSNPQVQKEISNPENYSFYHDVDIFLAQYPDCCEVGNSFSSNEDSVWHHGLRLLGKRSDVVYIEYVHPDANKLPVTGEFPTIKEFIAITNCGVAWDVVRGFRAFSDLNTQIDS